MGELTEITLKLEKAAHSPHKNAVYFKTGVGQYAEHDQFMGVKTPVLRAIAKEYKTLSLSDVDQLMVSPINEKRLLALFILIHRYQKGSPLEQENCYQFYLNHIAYVNNWNLVDASAHWIIGDYLMNRDKQMLWELAHSDNLWERRIAIVATWHFIRHHDLEWTFKLGKLLLHDRHDLMHKAVGWMLREAGKRDERSLHVFLEKHAATMPRTMLRYSLEKLSDEHRIYYMSI